MIEPIRTTVIWEHPDPELRLIIAINELLDRSELSLGDLARIFEYLRRRAEEKP